MMLTDLADACRKSGLKVVELDGWRSRTRPASTGSFNPRGILCHHTGPGVNGITGAKWMATVGRSDLPAPLCQIALDRDGTVYVCAAGRANHAGAAKTSGPLPAGDGNNLYIGIEAQNTGSEGWTDTQYDAYVDLCAAICAHYGWPSSHVRAHKETSVTGKWDPGMLNMSNFREDVASAISTLDKPKDWYDMATEADLKKIVDASVQAAIPDIVKAVLAAPVTNANPSGTKGTGKLGNILTNIELDQDRTNNLLAELAKKVDALKG